MVVEIEEIFFHCSKAFLRSQLWKPETWAPEARVERRPVLAQRAEATDVPLELLDAHYGPAYEASLYEQR